MPGTSATSSRLSNSWFDPAGDGATVRACVNRAAPGRARAGGDRDSRMARANASALPPSTPTLTISACRTGGGAVLGLTFHDWSLTRTSTSASPTRTVRTRPSGAHVPFSSRRSVSYRAPSAAAWVTALARRLAAICTSVRPVAMNWPTNRASNPSVHSTISRAKPRSRLIAATGCASATPRCRGSPGQAPVAAGSARG